MSAVLLWVRCVLRKHVAGTVAIALLGGVAAGVVGVAAQAARRADGALERNLARTRSYDLVVFGCAPGFDPTADDADLQQVDDKCRSLAATRQFRADVVSETPSIEASTVLGIYVIGIFDPAARNGWGRYILANGVAEADTGGMLASAVVQGRPLDENAPDEVMLGETAAARAGIHVGDEITIASWTPDELDFAIDGRVVPSTPVFTSRVVGIRRTLDDFQVSDAGNLRQTALPSSLFAGKAWVRAHGADLAGYGYATFGRVVPGVGIDAVVEALHTQAAASDRFVDSESVYEGNNRGALRRVIDTERQAVVVFAAIAALAGLALVGLTASRQLRSEMGGWRSLTALGMSTRDLVVAGLVRIAVVAVLASAVADLIIVLASPLAPIGIARRLEFSHPIRFDAAVLTAMPLALLGLFARIVGIALMSNAVSTGNDLAVGVTVGAEFAARLNPSSVPQSIVVEFSPDVDRVAAVESLADQFPGSARLPAPSADLGNLERLRWVPWMIAALVAILALASLVHALVTLLQRRAQDLAVFAALGLTRRQRLRVGVTAGLVLTGLSGLIGVPGGIVLGRWIWRVLARRAGVPSGSIVTWSPTLVAAVCALAVGAGVAAVAGRWVMRGSPAGRLRVE